MNCGLPRFARNDEGGAEKERSFLDMKSSDRKKIVANTKRVVVKVGSGVLTRRNGLNLNVIDDLTTDIARLRKKKIEVLLVASKSK